MASLRDLRRKMKAIQSTRQVTHAMELVAASKMRRAVESADRLRRYAWTAYRILERIAGHHPSLHPYLAGKLPINVLGILFTSDRGLCGSLNATLFRKTAQYISGLKTIPSFKEIQWIAVGKKGRQFLTRMGQNVTAAFPALSNRPTFKDILPIARMAQDAFLEGAVDHVVLIYTDFHSALRQTPASKVLLPLSRDELKDMLESLSQRGGKEASPRREAHGGQRGEASEGRPQEYLFEPNPKEIAETIIPKLTESQVFQAVLETAASEHSSRMVAMKNATDSATDLLDDLRLTYNQTRQANITRELAELSASKVALE
jgi:F-type H+-transporting ATPase subunit gamma